MGIFTTRFIDTFKESSLINNESSNYDVGEVMCNISSLALNEYYNCQSLLESTIGDEKQQLYLEAKMDVLLEFSIKDIGEKIKNAFKWLWEKIKELGRWIKGLFTKSKAKETKDNINKAKTEAQKNPEKAKINPNKELESKLDSEVSKIANDKTSGDTDNSTAIAAAVEKAIKEAETKYGEEEKKAAAATKAFYKIMYKPMLYFEPNWFIRKDFVQNTTTRLSNIKKSLDTFQVRDPKNRTMGDLTDFKAQLGELDTLSAFSPEYMKRFITSDSSLTKDNNGTAQVKMAKSKIRKAVLAVSADNMREEKTKIDTNSETAMISMIKWLDNKIHLFENNYIKSLESLSKTVENQISIVEKNIMGTINELSNKKYDITDTGYDNDGNTVVKNKQLSIPPSKIYFLQEHTMEILYQIKTNTVIVSSIYASTRHGLAELNIASKRICALFGISSI